MIQFVIDSFFFRFKFTFFQLQKQEDGTVLRVSLIYKDLKQ